VTPRLQPIATKEEITLKDLETIVDSFDKAIPRSEYQVEWRLLLSLRHYSRFVGLKSDAYITWKELAIMFSKPCGKTLRTQTLQRLTSHLKRAGTSAIDLFFSPPDPEPQPMEAS